MATILQLANADRSISTMMKSIKATDLEELLSGYGPFTILAPVNLAFGNLDKSGWDDLQKPANRIKLNDMLSFYILKEKKLHKDFMNGQKLRTIHGQELNVTVKDGEVRINGAKILAKDRQGSNGVVHSIDTVNMPLETISLVDQK